MEAQYAPQRFGRYVLLDRMGAGGMAEVFRAVVPGAEGFRRDLVVKRILSDRARAANFIEMFVHEARISALLHHPNVVQVFDFGQVDGSYFLAMELLRGKDLLAIFRALRERQQPFPIPIAAYVAQQVALGLGYAHALRSPDGQHLNIIHRDVSPANIMCLREGGVKLLDFGIAQAIGEMDSDSSDRSSFKGRLCYMAPERLRDEPQDGRVDLFSLGAVLWEMLTGRRLFHGKTEVDKLRSVLDKPIVPPSTLRPEIPASLDKIVLKVLARNRDDRYPTGQALAEDLEAVVSETKYQSRMLPMFLNELFGSAPSSAHLALSMASPEMLAFDPMVTPAATAIVSRTQTNHALPRAIQSLRGLPGRVKVAMAGCLLVASIASATLVSATRHAHRSSLASSAQHAAPVAASPHLDSSSHQSGAAASPGLAGVPAIAKTEASPGAAAVPAVSLAIGTEASRAIASHARSPAGPSASNRRVTHAPPARPVAARTTGRSGVGRITRGLSIDPFAEAAARGTRR